MPETPDMASNLKVQTAGKYDISVQKFKSKDFPSSPMKKTMKLNVNVKKAVNLSSSKTEVGTVTHAKTYGKRKYSFGGGGCGGTGGAEAKFSGPPFKRGRSKSGFIPPTKFLLGGNINDPLNLGSLADEEVNRSLNETTPYSSPVPTPKHRTQVEVLIPPNINDPLNLNAGDDAELELNFTSPKTKRRKYRKRKKTGSAETSLEISTTEKPPTEEGPIEDPKPSEKPETQPEASVSVQKTEETRPHAKAKRSDDKIVSPVTPQSGMRKRSNTFPCSKEELGKETVAKLDLQPKIVQKQNTSNSSSSNNKKEERPVNFRLKDARFQFGNYNRYYGYRNPDSDDERLRCLNKDWFVGKDVLDVGCNVGFLTLLIARDFEPRKIVGVDIDEHLIRAARKNVRHYIPQQNNIKDKDYFPISMAILFGPIIAPPPDNKSSPKFPQNVFFVQGNYVLPSDGLLETQKAEYDTILCLSVTKWVHLNWGDEGLKRMFKRMYTQLRPGGHLILEAQAWKSYSRKKKLTETIYENYKTIQLHPDEFTTYLLSKEVGFTTCRVIGKPENPSKGFQRPIQLFTKGNKPSPARSESSHEASTSNTQDS